MPKLTFLLLFLLFINDAIACRGPESEVAQEGQASILFEGIPTSYELDKSGAIASVTSGSVAKVSFDVRKTIRGEHKQHRSAIMRGHKLPKTLSEFTERFGVNLKVGLIDFKEKVNQNNLPQGYQDLPFVVDAVCNMNGEDWLLRPTFNVKKISPEEGKKLFQEKKCELHISYGSYASGIPIDIAKSIEEVLHNSKSISSFSRWNWGKEGEYDLCLKFTQADELEKVHAQIKDIIPKYSKKGYTTLYFKGEITKKTSWPPAGQ